MESENLREVKGNSDDNGLFEDIGSQPGMHNSAPDGSLLPWSPVDDVDGDDYDGDDDGGDGDDDDDDDDDDDGDGDDDDDDGDD